MPRGMPTAEFRRLAALGARSRIEQLQTEIARIRQQFPELAGSRAKTKSSAATVRRRRRMSAAARKSISTRMRAYWAARRREKEEKG